MRYLLALLLLVACEASPQWQMAGAESTRVTVGGHDYAVYRIENRFEVIRYGYAPRAEQADIRRTMLLVVRQVTGCTPEVDTGDSGEMRGRLTSCPRSRS